MTDEEVLKLSDEEILALCDHAVAQLDKMAPMSTEALIDVLGEPGDMDTLHVLFELFRRGALYQIIEEYPGDKDNVIDSYNEWCRVKKIVEENPPALTVPSATTVD